MWRMSRRTYTVLATGLPVLGLLVLLGSILALQTAWLQRADVYIRLAVFPGGVMAAVVIFLLGHNVEYHADLLPPKFRGRPSTRLQWQALYSVTQMDSVESTLKRFAQTHEFRESDAFAFGPDDCLGDLMREFYPGQSDLDAQFRRVDLTSHKAGSPLGQSLRQYVDARLVPAAAPADADRSRPHAADSTDPPQIDRAARVRLARVIRLFTDETITAFAFDEEIHAIRAATADKTVRFIVDQLWFHYDDVQDHLATLSKSEWDYFQRLLLILESQAVIERVHRRRWTARQIVAALAFAGFAAWAWRSGLGWHLLGLAIPFGPISLLLASWRKRADRRDPRELHRAPFASFAELRAVRESAPQFAKQRYPGREVVREIHSPLVSALAHGNAVALWSLASPVILLCQALPEKETQIRVHCPSRS